MQKILLIKIGALGDVVRTTCLLRIVKGDITWVTKINAFPLLKNNPFIREVCDIRSAHDSLHKNKYDLIVNLDEEPAACALAGALNKKELVGAYEDRKKTVYTPSSAEWFDMGLISRFDKKTADQKKWENQKYYQEIVFGMLGKKFNGEEYILPYEPRAVKDENGVVGVETRSGDRWMGKRWSRFPEFLELLKKNRVPYLKFKTFPTLEQFIHHINKTDLVVTTDSLALHISLALRKKVLSLFTCTSFREIHGYGRMTRIVSPLIEKYFYSTDTHLKSGEAIEPQSVFEELINLRDKKIPPFKSGTFPSLAASL